MLRANLATRPFYNERAIHLLLAAAAVVVLAITVWNVSRIVTLSRHSTELSARTNAERSEASRLSTEAVRIRKTINKDELTLVVNAAQEANALIEKLETTGYFENLIPASSEKTEENLWRATITSVYVGNVAAAQENPPE